MSAVGRLLDRADEVRRFFDEMLQIDQAIDTFSVVRSLKTAVRIDGGMAADATDFLGSGFLTRVRILCDAASDALEKPYRDQFPPEQWALLGRWMSEDALSTAAAIAQRNAGSRNDSDSERLVVSALKHYLTFLQERERLLDPHSLQELRDGAVKGSLAWGPLAPAVVQRAESVADALRGLYSPDVNTRERWREERESRIDPACLALRQYADPPPVSTRETRAPATPTSGGKGEQERLKEWATALAPKWTEYRDSYDGPGRALIAKFLEAELRRAPTAGEIKALKTAIGTYGRRVNRQA